MKAHWTVDDFTQTTYRSLPFTEQDTILIQRGLEQRCPAWLLLAAEILEVISSPRILAREEIFQEIYIGFAFFPSC